jgi:hypothetical protein
MNAKDNRLRYSKEKLQKNIVETMNYSQVLSQKYFLFFSLYLLITMIYTITCEAKNQNNIQGVSEIRVLILTNERTRQFIKLFSITFCKIRKSIPRFFVPQFLPNESFCVIN